MSNSNRYPQPNDTQDKRQVKAKNPYSNAHTFYIIVSSPSQIFVRKERNFYAITRITNGFIVIEVWKIEM